jgi:hypothetical protein
MKYTHRLLVLLVCLATLALGLVSTALAQDDEATETARERFKEGVQYFDRNEFGKARVAFAQAYALKKHPDVLLNLGMSELRTDGYEVDAAAHLAEYLRQAPDSDKREEAEEALEEAKEKVVTVNIEVDVPVTAVLVDDEPYAGGPVPGPIFLEPGSHTIELKTKDDAKSNDVTADAGDERTVEFHFAAKSNNEASQAAAVTSESKKKSRTEKTASPESGSNGGRMPFFKWVSKRPLAIVLGGVFVSGAGAGAGFLFAAQNEYDNADVLEAGILARSQLDAALAETTDNPEIQAFADRLSRQGPCGGGGAGPVALTSSDTRYQEWCDEYYATTARGDDYQTISIIGFGVGGAALIAIPVYYLLDTKPHRKSAGAEDLAATRTRRAPIRVAPAVAGGFGGLTLQGRF